MNFSSVFTACNHDPLLALIGVVVQMHLKNGDHFSIKKKIF